MGSLSNSNKTAQIASIECFRVPPRWLFIKITDSGGDVGWREAPLEGHSEAVEGCLDAFQEGFVGTDAEGVLSTAACIGLPRETLCRLAS